MPAYLLDLAVTTDIQRKHLLQLLEIQSNIDHGISRILMELSKAVETVPESSGFLSCGF